METIYELIGYIYVWGILDFFLPHNNPIINFIGSMIMAIFVFFAIGFQGMLTNRYKQHLFDKHKDNIQEAYDEINSNKKNRNYSIVIALFALLLLHVTSVFL